MVDFGTLTVTGTVNVAKLAIDVVKERISNSNLKIIRYKAFDVYYDGSNPRYYRRFVTLRVTNLGRKVASNCWGAVTLPELGYEKIPLHWADTPYDKKRDSMIPIDISPNGNVERDLDIAFSVYGNTFPGAGSITSGPIYTSTSVERRISHRTAGTFDPRFVPTGARFSDELVPQQNNNKKNPSRTLEGAWLATHLDIGDLEPRLTSQYRLTPTSPIREYDVTVNVFSDSGRGDRVSFKLLVGHNPSTLDFKER